ACDRLTSLHCECAALEAAKLGQSELGGRCTGEHASRLLEKKPARFGQLDVATYAMKQRSRIGIFQSEDRSADCLLRQVQGFGGTGDVLAFGDSDEDAQLLKGHAVFIALMSKPARAPASRRAGAPLWNPLCQLIRRSGCPGSTGGSLGRA